MTTRKHRARLFLLVFLAIATALVIYDQWAKWQKKNLEEKTYLTKIKLDRLLVETRRLFKDRQGLTEGAFWTRAGVGNVWKDGWDRPFRLDTINRKDFYWESSGPDETFGTKDDIREPVWPIEPPLSPWGVADPIVDKK